MPDNQELQPNGKMWLLVILVLVAFAGALYYFDKGQLAFSGLNQAQIDNSTNGRQPRLYTVYYNTGVFSPTNIRVHIGDSIKFLNDSVQEIRIISDDTDGVPELIGFDSVGNIPPEGFFIYTFNKEGSFGYHNTFIKTERGTVIVRP